MNWLQRLGIAKAVPTALRQPERLEERIRQPQARPSWDQSSFGFVNPFFRISAAENLYLNEQLVEMVPCINAAVDRLADLAGCPKVESKNAALAEELNDWWMNRLKTNMVQMGGPNLFSGWNKAHLVYGRAHVEIIPTYTYSDIYALQLLHTRTISARPKASGYGVEWVQDQGLGFFNQEPLNPHLLMTAVHDIRTDNPNGCSLLYGLPFMSEILNKMTTSLKNTWERFGTPSYFVNYRPAKEISDPNGTNAAAVVASALTGLESAVLAKANGQARDFGAAGDFSVEILGAAGENLDISVPGRFIVEQIVGKLGLPPWMLGLHWSTTERMSSVQASLISETVNRIRQHLEPELRILFNLRQAFVGRPFDFKIVWEAPSLIDAMESAQAAKVEAEADAARLKHNERLWNLGIVEDWMVARDSRPDLEGATEAEVRAACPGLLAMPPMPMMLAPGGGSGQPGEEPPPGREPLGLFGRSLTYASGWGRKNGNGHGH